MMKQQIKLLKMIVLPIVISYTFLYAQLEEAMSSVLINQERKFLLVKSITTESNYKYLDLNSIITSHNLLIPVRHPWTPTSQNIYTVNSNITQSNLQKRLFADEAKIDLEASISGDNNYSVSFMLDPIWDRIIFSQKNGNWVKSYGDHSGEYQFSSPRGMTLDSRGNIFVADYYNNKIVKLFYDKLLGTVSFVSANSINGIMSPVDIAIEQSGRYCCPDQDRIWIADDVLGKIIQIDRAGTVLNSIEYYTVTGKGTFRLNKPLKILAREKNVVDFKYIAFIDEERNSFIVSVEDCISGNNITALCCMEFDKNITRRSELFFCCCVCTA